MKIASCLVVLVSIAAVGCNKKSSSVPNNSSVTEVTPPPTYYQPAPQPYQPVQPTVYDTAPPANASSGATPAPVAASGNTYTVKKGDTLYGIAKSRYGNGNQYTKIVAANPGLDPSKLRVGQTITIP